MSVTLRLPAPAKLNLFLHITGRRADGYHELQTLFQLIDWHDGLAFTPRPDAAVQLHDPASGVPAAQNLILRAAALLRPHAQSYTGVDIHLQKNLPMGGGIGGGSSDAATTLLALNQLWHCGLDLPRLARLGLQLGADVPVFVQGRNAWAEGVGEALQPVDLPPQTYVVLKPDCFISTGDLFSQETLTRDTPKTTFAAYRLHPDVFRNDCEPVARALFPAVNEALCYLSRFGSPRLTGTGACVFLPVLDDSVGQEVVKNAPCPGQVVHSLDRSPVHAQLGL